MKATVLFEQPQQEIATLIRDKLQLCHTARIVTGFATVEGVKIINKGILSQPSKLKTFVIGAGTYRGFEALDDLLLTGVSGNSLYVHLGHTRLTGAQARHPFYRYHPMLHSKVYLLEMTGGKTVAFIGSHNITGFALLGLNGEASVMLEGETNDPEIQKIRQHIDLCQSQAIAYSSAMKSALAWWYTEAIDGLKAKFNDQPRDSEFKKTIVIMAVEAKGDLPKAGEVIYFEMPEALHQIRALDTEVHIYVFSKKPATPFIGLKSLKAAQKSLWCKADGLETKQGGLELMVDWYIKGKDDPLLLRAPKPFRPAVSNGMVQVRVTVKNEVWNQYEYLFDNGEDRWEPVLGKQSVVVASENRELLTSLNIVPPEDKEWFLVQGLQPTESRGNEAYKAAMRVSRPESGSFILMSLRRRSLSKQE